MSKLFFLFLFSLIVVVGISGVVSAVDCPSGWTFIDKVGYNICYLPNSSSSSNLNTLNITDDNNITLLSYYRETHTVNGSTRFYSVNFTDMKNYLGVDYIDYYGKDNVENNSITFGTFYFMDDYIINSGNRYNMNNLTNASTSERTVFKNFNIVNYSDLSNGVNYTSNGGSGAIVLGKTIKHNSNLKNFTVGGRVSEIYLNKTYLKYIDYSPLNNSISVAFNRSYSGSASDTRVEIRNENETELFYSVPIATKDSTGMYYYSSLHYIVFNTSYINPGDNVATGNYNSEIFDGLFGRTSRYTSPCASGFDNIDHSCNPWGIAYGLFTTLYISKISSYNIFSNFTELRSVHGRRLYFNESLVRRYMLDYDFFVPTNQGLTQNRYNYTATRLNSDYLRAIMSSNYTNQATNQVALDLIDILQNNTIRDPVYNWTIIAHSRNTQQYFDNWTVINTHSSGTVALIKAKQNGFTIDNDKLSTFINSLISFQYNIFNQSNGNDSYYAIGGSGEYFNESNGLTYVLSDISEFRIAYMYNKSEALRNISNKKINEMNFGWNGSAYLEYYGGSNNTPVINNFSLSRGNYRNLSINAFTQSGYEDPVIVVNFIDGIDNIPNNRKFNGIDYPLFLSDKNTTFFVDEEDNLMFESPIYFMANDFKYDNSGKGMKIYIKWAYNSTNGNFTNLSQSPYQLFYSPQHSKFISYREVLNFTATSGINTYWTGNISSSTTLNIIEGVGTNLSVDNENLGILTNSTWFSSSTSTEKRIASNLSQGINATVVIDVYDCESIGTIQYTPKNGTTQTIGRSSYTCEDKVVTLSNLQINPSSESNVLIINYDAYKASAIANVLISFSMFGVLMLVIVIGFIIKTIASLGSGNGLEWESILFDLMIVGIIFIIGILVIVVIGLLP